MGQTTFAAGYAAGHAFSGADLALVIGLHIAAAALLLSVDAGPLATPPTALMVRTISPEPPAAEAAPPHPTQVPLKQPAQRRAVPAPQRAVLAAETPAPASPPTATPTPTLAPAQPAAPASIAAAPVAREIPVFTEPRFDANYRENPAPAYPALARRLGEEGKVTLRVFVEPDGRPNLIEVKNGSGSPRLDEAAIDAVRRWKFVPARHGTDAVGAWVLVPIAFNLRG